MATTDNQLVTAKGLANALGEVAGGGASVCELTLTSFGITEATFHYQGLDGTFSYETVMSGNVQERVVQVPVCSVVAVDYEDEPGIDVSYSGVTKISDAGTATSPRESYLVTGTMANISILGVGVSG